MKMIGKAQKMVLYQTETVYFYENLFPLVGKELRYDLHIVISLSVYKGK